MQEIINSIALTQLKNIGTVTAKYLYDALGSATAVMEHRKNIRDVIPDATQRLVEALSDVDEAFRTAEAELEFIGKKSVKAICMNDSDYPKRLRNCDDAPIVLFYCGNADLNRKHIISMVGTRDCSEYGKELCSAFVADVKKKVPDALIVSGLAYGIDVNSHRAALENELDTVGVLAHGLDRIYPAAHRNIASRMVQHGGVLTEYIHNTQIDRTNFLKRNRIVAGMCDACIVVESASHGGSLVTADLANNYNRDVFSFPGRIFDEHSKGCNKLIRENKALLIESADDMIKAMGWDVENERPKYVQNDLFDMEKTNEPLSSYSSSSFSAADSTSSTSASQTLSAEEMKIMECLKGVDFKSINLIVNETGVPFGMVSSLVFELEAKGLVDVLGGARIKLHKVI